jgi:hypothetical protein
MTKTEHPVFYDCMLHQRLRLDNGEYVKLVSAVHIKGQFLYLWADSGTGGDHEFRLYGLDRFMEQPVVVYIQ